MHVRRKPCAELRGLKQEQKSRSRWMLAAKMLALTDSVAHLCNWCAATEQSSAVKLIRRLPLPHVFEQ